MDASDYGLWIINNPIILKPLTNPYIKTEFKDKFEEEGIKTEHLIQMTENDLKEMMKELGMKKLGD